MLRDVIMAFAFGTQGSVAALLVAFRWSHLLRRLLGEGALQTAFIPHFEKLRAEDPHRAGLFFRDLAAALTLLLITIVAISMAGLGVAMLYGDFSPGNQEILFLTFIMMPGLLFICLYGLNASLLQCEKHYFTSSIAPIAFNVVWIGGILAVWQISGPNAMPWLASFIVLGCIAEWLMTVPKTWKILGGFGIDTLWKGAQLYSSDLKTLAKPLLLGMVGVGAAQVNNAMDTVFARYASEEGPAYLWYAIRLQQLPLALFGIALSGALLPPLSRAIKGNDIPKYLQFLDYALQKCSALMIPITFAIFALGASSINLIYGHGDFNDSSTSGTTTCLWAYGVGLLPMAYVLILAPAFYSKGDYKTPTQASVIAMSVNMGLNALLVMGMGLGAASVALATSVSAWINAGYLAFFLKREVGSCGTQNLLFFLGKVTLISSAAFIAVAAGEAWLFNESYIGTIISGGVPSLPRTLEGQLWLFGSGCLCFAGIAAPLGYFTVYKKQPIPEG